MRPVALLILNGRELSLSPSVLPSVIDHPFPFASSPVEAIVRTLASFATFSAIVAELPVMAIATLEIVMVMVSVAAAVPSVAETTKL